MSEDQEIKQEAIRFMDHLGLPDRDNYFLIYRYPRKIFGLPLFLLPWNNLMQSVMTSICLMVVTKDEVVIKKLSNGLSIWKLKKWNFDKQVLRIPKAAIKSFKMEDWDNGMGLMLTLETADQTYYLEKAGMLANDFSTANFNNVRGNDFYGLLTEDTSTGGYSGL